MRFPGFTEEWEIKKLQDVVKINQGLQIMISERLIEAEDGAHFYITNEFLKKSSEKKYFIKNPPSSVLCTEEDILMTRTGNTGMVVTNVSGAFHNNFFKVAYPETIVKGFLYNFLKLPDTQKQIIRLAGTSTIPDLNHSDFYNIKFTFPKKTEQSKIASFVAVIDERIQTQNKIIEQLKTLILCFRNQIFSQKIRFKNENGTDFSEWNEVKIGEILKIGSGKDYKHLQPGNIPVFGTGGLMTLVNDYIYDGETVCIGRKGTIDKPMYNNGKIWTVDTLFYTHSFQSCIPKFIFHLFRTINWLEYNEASGVLSLSKTTIEKINIQIPSVAEQIQIATFLCKLDQKIQTEKAIVKQLVVQKKYLLQQMFI